MNKEYKYSLEYAIGSSIQENKDKIEKLEKKVRNLTNKNKKLQHQLEEKDMVIKKQNKIINQAYNNIEATYSWRKEHSNPSTVDVPLMTLCEEQLEILEKGKNVNSK